MCHLKSVLLAYLCNRRVGRAGCDEGNRGGGGIVGHHRLLDDRLDLADVAQGAHRANALEQRPAVHHPKQQEVVNGCKRIFGQMNRL